MFRHVHAVDTEAREPLLTGAHAEPLEQDSDDGKLVVDVHAGQ